MRLKPAGIFIIVAIIAVLAYFALRPKQSDSVQENSTEISTPANTNTDSSKSNSTSSTVDATTEAREFNYTPEQPENGSLRGVVELGATGFNSFVINMDCLLYTSDAADERS